MAANPVLRHLTRVPRLWAALMHLALLAANIVLFLGRKPGMFRIEAIVARVPDFYLHVSNLAISYLLYAGIGYLWLMMGIPMKPVAWAGAGLIAANVVYEMFLPILNTRDGIDALYGVVGVACGFVVLWVIDRHGLVPNPASQSRD